MKVKEKFVLGAGIFRMYSCEFSHRPSLFMSSSEDCASSKNPTKTNIRNNNTEVPRSRILPIFIFRFPRTTSLRIYVSGRLRPGESILLRCLPLSLGMGPPYRAGGAPLARHWQARSLPRECQGGAMTVRSCYVPLRSLRPVRTDD